MVNGGPKRLRFALRNNREMRPWGAWQGRQALSLAKAEGRTGVVQFRA